MRAGDLRRIDRGYPGPDHRMPVCCDVMYAEMLDAADAILAAPPKGKGASLVIEYLLPPPQPGPLAVSQ